MVRCVCADTALLSLAELGSGSTASGQAGSASEMQPVRAADCEVRRLRDLCKERCEQQVRRDSKATGKLEVPARDTREGETSGEQSILIAQ